MRDVFISHADEQGDLAVAIAAGLNAAGFTTWCYEDDSDAGLSYLSQIDEEIEATQAVVLLISRSSLASPQVLKEIVRAHESGKPFIPLRCGVPHDAVHEQREWRMALGAAVSIAIPPEGVGPVLPRIVRSLHRIGIQGSSGTAAPPAPASSQAAMPRDATSTAAPSSPAASLAGSTRTSSAPPLAAAGRLLERARDPGASSLRLWLVGAVGLLGVVLSFINFVQAVAPDPRSSAYFLYQMVPTIRAANTLANLLGLVLNGLLIHAAYRLYAGRAGARRRIRLISAGLLVMVAGWFIVVFFAALFPPHGGLVGSQRLAVIGASVVAALFGAVPPGLVFAVFGADRGSRGKGASR